MRIIRFKKLQRPDGNQLPLDFNEWHKVVYSYRKNLLRYAKSVTQNADESEELVSAIIEKAIFKRDKFYGGNIEAWLITMLKNHFKNEQKSLQRRKTDCFEDFTRVNKPDTFAAADAFFANEDFNKAFKEIPQAVAKQRKRMLQDFEVDELNIISAMFVQGQPIRDIALAINKKRTYVNSIVCMIRAILRKKLKDYR